MNPATAFAVTLADELVRCGLAEAVIAPGSRSTPLALALWERGPGGQAPGLRLHVRIDERSAAFLALGLAKASGRPVAVVCTSGTAAAEFHAAVIEADEAAVPLLVLTADRPPELRGTGANQTIDQLKLYGGAVRWFCEAGVPEARAGMNAYWRSLACRAWAAAHGAGGGRPGPVHINIPLREPLVPAGDEPPWQEPLTGRPGGQPWTVVAVQGDGETGGGPAPLALPWTERGVVLCGDGTGDPGPLLELARTAGWPVLAEPSSGARQGPNALGAYQYLLGSAEFLAGHRPEVVVTAGRPGLSRAQLGFLRDVAAPAGPARHVVIGQGAGWADPARSAAEVAAAVRLCWPGGATPRTPPQSWPGGATPRTPPQSWPGEATAPQGRDAGAGPGEWLASWQRADAAARQAADAVLDGEPALSEPRLARDLAALLPAGSLLWAASSLPIRDLDHHAAPRAGLRVLASRGASGIDGLVSSAIGAALAHQAAGGGRAVALLGDLAFLHDAPGLMLGPEEPRPDLTLLVVNNNGGGIFSTLEQAALPGPFERVFGTPHQADLAALAAAAGLPCQRVTEPAGLAEAVSGSGLRVVEVCTERAAGAALRARLRAAAGAALSKEAAG